MKTKSKQLYKYDWEKHKRERLQNKALIVLKITYSPTLTLRQGKRTKQLQVPHTTAHSLDLPLAEEPSLSHATHLAEEPSLSHATHEVDTPSTKSASHFKVTPRNWEREKALCRRFAEKRVRTRITKVGSRQRAHRAVIAKQRTNADNHYLQQWTRRVLERVRQSNRAHSVPCVQHRLLPSAPWHIAT